MTKINQAGKNKHWQRYGATRSLICRNLKMKPSSQLYVDIPEKEERKETCVDGSWGFGGIGMRRRGRASRGLTGDGAGGMPILKGKRGSGPSRGGFGQHLYSKLWGSVELLECGSTSGLEPHTRVTFIRTGKRNRLPWMIYGRACILGMWYCNLCYRIRTSVSREVNSLTMRLPHQGPSNSHTFYLGCLLA